MRTRPSVLLAFLLVLNALTFAQSVTITGKKVIYTRRRPISEYKKTFEINYPKVKAASPALARKIENAISYRSILGLNLQEELTSVQWLESADYKVVYNDRGVLCIDLSMEGSGAYPSGVTKTAVVDVKTGTLVKTSDVFTNLQGLAAMVRKAQKKEIQSTVDELKKEPEFKGEDPADLFKQADFRRKDLEGYAVNDRGVTFKYEYGLPHAIQAFEPAGEYFFTWSELRPYLVPGGLLARLAH
jgi:hypothetical protein